MIRWPDFFPESLQAQVQAVWLDAKVVFEHAKSLPTIPMETALLKCGLAPVREFLRKVRVIIRAQSGLAVISFDEIQESTEKLKFDFLYAMWSDIGFDRDGRRLPSPVTGPVRRLSSDALATIQGLEVNAEIEQELRAIAGVLSGERTPSGPQPLAETSVPASLAESEPMPEANEEPDPDESHSENTASIPFEVESEARLMIEPEPLAISNREDLERFRFEMGQALGIKILNEYIALVAGYSHDSQLLRFQRDDDGKVRPTAQRVSDKGRQRFRQVLTMSPDRFRGILKKQVGLHPDLKKRHPDLSGLFDETN